LPLLKFQPSYMHWKRDSNTRSNCTKGRRYNEPCIGWSAV